MTAEEIRRLVINGNLYYFRRPGGLDQILYTPGCDLAPFEDREILELMGRIGMGQITASDEEQERIRETFWRRRNAIINGGTT